jgi:thioredoxin 1
MPYVEGIEGKFEGKVKFTKIDASKNRRLCINLKVIDLPTYLFYKSGKEVNRLKGDALTIEQIEEAAKKLTE